MAQKPSPTINLTPVYFLYPDHFPASALLHNPLRQTTIKTGDYSTTLLLMQHPLQIPILPYNHTALSPLLSSPAALYHWLRLDAYHHWHHVDDARVRCSHAHISQTLMPTFITTLNLCINHPAMMICTDAAFLQA